MNERGDLEAIGAYLVEALAKLTALQAGQTAMQASINTLTGKVQQMSDSVAAELATLQADVSAETTVEASAITLIQGFAAQLAAAVAAAQAAGATPAQLASLSTLGTTITTSSAALAAAVAANTPAAPPATP